MGQFVEVSKPNIHLSLYRGFLEVKEKGALLSRIPLDDILGLVITGHGCTHSSNILAELSSRSIPISICGSNFTPRSIVLPLVGNSKQNTRIQSQINMNKNMKKRLWKEVVKLKIKHQSLVLEKLNLSYKKLKNMSNLVRSGDPENLEAQAARFYWLELFSKNFKRDKNAEGINAMLNYGYAIIRSCVARGVVAAGLHPSIGIHHRNTYNPMCLIDDLMEPFRPIVDYVVKQMFENGYNEIDKESKEILSRISNLSIESQTSLFQVISRYATLFAIISVGEKKKFNLDWSLDLELFDLDLIRSQNMSDSA